MINDSFAGIDALAKEETITAQISSGFNKTYRDIARSAADQMAKQDASTEADYQEAQVEEYRQWNEMEDAVINELLQNKQPVTANNLAAANMLMNKRGRLYKQLDEYTKPEDKEKVKGAVSHIQEAMTDKDAVQEAFEEMQHVFEEILEEAKYADNIHYIDLKEIQSCQKQLSLARNLAQEENYHIPVEIHGETTAIHLRVLHGKEKEGKVRATLETQEYGQVAAEFSIRNKEISGYIACSASDGANKLQEREEALCAGLKHHVGSLGQNAMKLGNISIVHSKELDLNGFMAQEQPEGSSASTADLYQIAKAFINVITA